MSEKKYHHSDLKEELITEGIKLINKIGYSDFTIRKLAKACNVSHNAPYRHFKGKEELIQAIIVRVISAIKEGLTIAMVKSSGNALDQIKQIGYSYIEFFVENPEYFSILFNGDMMGHVFVENGILTFDETPLFGNLVECFKAHWKAKNQPFNSSIVLEYWSTIHGFTTLITSQKIVFKDSYKDYISEMIDRLAARLA